MTHPRLAEILVADVDVALRLAAGLLLGLTVAALALVFHPQRSPGRAEAAR
jgi:hypothetical protein